MGYMFLYLQNVLKILICISNNFPTQIHTYTRTYPAFLGLILLDSSFATNFNFLLPVNLKFRIYIFLWHIVLPQHIRWHQLVIPDNLFYEKSREQQENSVKKISWTRHFTTVGQLYFPFWYYLTSANQKVKMPQS